MRPPHAPLRLALVLLTVSVVGACGDDTPAPEPGEVTVRLVGPAGAEGGAVFEIEGETITDAATGAGLLFVRQVEGRSRVVLVREPAGELSFTMEVANVRQPPGVEVLQVAGPDDALRPSLSAYRAEVEVRR